MNGATSKRRLFLRSKVARRVLLLFVVCAALPLSVFAFFTFRQITSEFNRLTDERLRQSSKWAAMAVMGRLATLDMDLSVVAQEFNRASDPSAAMLTTMFQSRLQDRFRSIVFVKQNGSRVAETVKAASIPKLTPDELKHLQSGRMLVTVQSTSGAKPAVYVVRQNGSPGSGWAFVFAEVEPDYLWGGAALESSLAGLTVTDAAGNALYSSDPKPEALAALRVARNQEQSSGRFEWTAQDKAYTAGYWKLFMRHDFYPEWVFVYSESRDDALRPVREYRNLFLLVVLMSFWIVLFLSLSQIRKTMVPVEMLKAASERIAAKDLATRVEIHSGDEFEDLGQSFNGMTTSLQRHVETMSTINEIGVSLSAEPENRRLLDLVVSGAKRILNADGAILYLVNPDGQLQLFSMRIDSLNIAVDADRIPSGQFAGGLTGDTLEQLAVQSVLRGQTVNIADAYSSELVELSAFLQFDLNMGYRTRSILGVPLRNHENTIIGIVELINARDRTTGETVTFSEEDMRTLESLGSQAAVAMTKNQLAADFRKLFESLTGLIARAIDDKSPYTGAHCKRVPILSMMLAEAVCRTTEGPFRDFSFTEDELYELKIASLLHDCGKVVTPVHVVDKSTKLETIFDRINLIDTRFEIIRRDREIELLRQALGLDSRSMGVYQVDQLLEKHRLEIEQDRAFLHESNQGSEYMPESSRQKVRRIAQKYRWQTSSREELPFLSDDEVNNLTIQKGTLNAEEREIINNHVVETFELLKELPYPANLRNVPVYAAAHHERMDGSGYPNGLHQEDIAIQGRIIGIADIFEALTAKDRPYKKMTTLSEALAILSSMCNSGHVDRDLYETFIREKVYLPYAQQYLDPEQIDDVDCEALLPSRPSMPRT